MMRCSGCGRLVVLGPGGPWACPGRATGDDVDHVLVPVVSRDGVSFPRSGSDNPFIRYRRLLASYRPDLDFVQLVESLDDAIAAVDGKGFRITPVVRAAVPSAVRSTGLGCW